MMIQQSRGAICHPKQIPLEISTLSSFHHDDHSAAEANMGELDFNSPYLINVGEVLMIRIPSVNQEMEIRGQVIWMTRAGCGYMIGISFYGEKEAFQMRMLEQLCHIEAYRKDIHEREGRELSREQAAEEWIEYYAASFPGITPVAA